MLQCWPGRLTYQNLLCCCFFLVSSLWLSTSPLVSLTLIASRSGQEMLNLDSPKLFKMETGRQMWEHQCSRDSCNEGVCIKTSICLGCERWCVYLVLLSKPGQAARTSQCLEDLVVICHARGFTTRWLLLGSQLWFILVREGLRKKPRSFPGSCQVRLDLRLLNQHFLRCIAYVIGQNTLENTGRTDTNILLWDVNSRSTAVVYRRARVRVWRWT